MRSANYHNALKMNYKIFNVNRGERDLLIGRVTTFTNLIVMLGKLMNVASEQKKTVKLLLHQKKKSTMLDQ